MAGARNPTLDVNYSDTDRENDDDASATARLLPSSETTDRGSFEYKEPFHDQNSSSDQPNGNHVKVPHSFGSERGSSCFARNRRWITIVGCVLLVLIGGAWIFRPNINLPFQHHLSHTSSDTTVAGFSTPRNTVTFLNGTTFVKPPELKIIGIIFYGRRQFVNVLECYLRRNLKVNGGMLDEIHFLMHTDEQQDINWITNLVKSDQLRDYYKLKAEDTSGKWSLWGSFPDLYRKFMTDPNTIYIKMDDDLTFIDDHAIPELLRVTLEHPEAHSVQANIVNNQWNHWHHLRSQAIWPYLADTNKSSKWPENSWRPSQLPRFNGKISGKRWRFPKGKPPPSKGHRWLPLDPPSYEALYHTPYGAPLRNPMFKSRDKPMDWHVAAQAHYSFFENYERRELTRYSYGNDHDHTWNQWYTRYNINMFAIRGSYVSMRPVWDDRYKHFDKGDEFLLSIVIPKSLNMPVLIATRAVAAHYSFRKYRANVLQTDILDRYRSLANDMYCEANNQRPRLGAKVGPHHLRHYKASLESESEDDVVADGPQDRFNINDDEDDDDDDDDGEDSSSSS